MAHAMRHVQEAHRPPADVAVVRPDDIEQRTYRRDAEHKCQEWQPRQHPGSATLYRCSLDLGHDGAHRAYVDGGLVAGWPRRPDPWRGYGVGDTVRWHGMRWMIVKLECKTSVGDQEETTATITFADELRGTAGLPDQRVGLERLELIEPADFSRAGTPGTPAPCSFSPPGPISSDSSGAVTEGSDLRCSCPPPADDVWPAPGCPVHGEPGAPRHTLNHPGSDRWTGGDRKDEP
jgi:hypothetical protein